MKYDLNKYKFTTYQNVVEAASTYAGKEVVGMARCHPSDEFVLAQGKELAAARCNARVAEKRRKRAKAKMIEAQRRYDEAKNYKQKMERYYDDSCVAEKEANAAVDKIMKTIE